MGLTGLQIQKLLPKTNCKECGCNTCLAFAMKLAAKKAELAECPYASEEAKAVIAAATEPPVRTVTVGHGGREFNAGGETVMFRHEKSFVHQTGLGLAIDDSLDDSAVQGRVRMLQDYRLERVGETLTPDLVSIAFTSGSRERFVDVCGKVASVWDGALAVRVVLPADESLAGVSLLTEAAHALRGRRPLLASATPATAGTLCGIAAETGSALALTAESLNDLVRAVEILRAKDYRDIFLEPRAYTLCERYQNSEIIRRGALKTGVKVLGYPIITYVDTGDAIDDAVEAGIAIATCCGLVVLPEFDPASWTSLLTLRQNIFTDPQKPIQVEPGVYPVGEPNETSPVFVTTNFSLTYFIVSGEIENSGVSAWLVVPECEGMSVLTAWAAGKFSGDKVGSFVREVGLEDRITSRRIIIPGYVAQISGELEEALPDWEVMVGPQDAGDIESFVRNVLKV
ncbi:MAG: acetyl-CoA decarbonylase/synthase complex subunit gamma [Phycisphaerae bacterium]